MTSPLATAATVHQAAWPGAARAGLPRTTTAKLEVLDKALAELRRSQTFEMSKAVAYGNPGRDAWLRKAIDAVEMYRSHLARRAVLENDQEALSLLSPSDIQAAGETLAKASIVVGLSGRPGLARRPGLR
jgi:hypothetical protein